MVKNKILNFFKNYYYAYLPVIISVATVLILKPSYDIDRDDLVLANMVHSAAYNPNSEYLVFISYILGYLMRFMVLAFPALNVYVITLIASMTFGFGVFFYNIKKYDNKAFFVLLLCLSQIYVIFGISFTVVSFVCSAAGVALVLSNVKKLDKSSIKYFVISFILVFLGFSFRRSSVVVAVFMLFVPVSFFAVKHKRITISAILVMTIIFTGTYEFLKISQDSYKEKLFEGTDYLEFNKYRGIATDSGDLSYSRHQELFDSNGISKNDVKLCDWFFYNDKTIMPTEKVKIISESHSFSNKYTLNPIEIAKSFLRKFNIFLFLVAFVMMSIVLLIICKKGRREIFLSLLFVCGAVLYLHIRKRGVDRVVKPIVFIGYMQVIEIYLRDKIVSFPDKWIITRITAAVVVAIHVIGLGIYMVPEKEMDINAKNCIEYIKNDTEYNYVPISAVKTSAFLSFKMTEPLLKNMISNVYTGWMVYSPYWYSLLERYEIYEYKDSLYLSLIDEDIKIVCGYQKKLQTLVEAIREHYNIEVEIKEEKNFGDYLICTLREVSGEAVQQ